MNHTRGSHNQTENFLQANEKSSTTRQRRKRKKAHTQNFYCDTRDEYRMVKKVNKCHAKRVRERKKKKKARSANPK